MYQGIIALIAVAVNGTKPDGTPFAIFSSGVAGFLEQLGLPVPFVAVITLFVGYLLTLGGYNNV